MNPRGLILMLVLALVRSSGWAQVTVNPDTLGAVGDGVTWDHAALQAAIDAAGVGGTVVLTHGKTYLVCSRITLKPGRTLIGNGATVKRCNSLLSSLTSAAFEDDTSIDVQDPEHFEIDQAISVFTGPTRAEGEAMSTPKIVNIAGSTLTLSEGLTADYPIGAGVIAIDDLFSAAGDNIAVEGVVFDGNRRNNDEWIAWERGTTIITNGSNISIHGNLFVDCWSNCLKPFSTNQLVVTENVFDSVAAAVIHMSSTDSLLFEGNHMVDTNYNLGAGHSEAAFTWSAANMNNTVRDNCLNRSSTGAFGTINRRTNRDITIEENLVCDSNGFFRMRLQGAPDPGFEDYGRLIVRDNVGVNVGESRTVHGGALLPPIGNLRFIDNKIVNGYVFLDGLDSALVSGNTVHMLDFATYGPQDADFEDRAGLISLDKPMHTVVTQNTLVGGEKGMYFRMADSTPPDSLIVSNNVVVDSERGGIITAKVNWLVGNSDERSDNSGIRLDSNIVSTQLLSTAGDAGLWTTRGITVADNCVETNRIGAEVTGTDTTLATGSPETFYLNNTLVGASGAVSFRSADYVSDILFDTNTVSVAIPPEFEAATGTLLQGNLIDGGASCDVPPEPPIPSCTVCNTDMPELDGVFFDGTILLEGAYAGGGAMSTSAGFEAALEDSGWAHPYGAEIFVGTPLEYHGTEFIQPDLPVGIIDWVVVALRSAPGAGTEVARVAGILMDDGSIRSLDATIEIFFPSVAKGSYYVVVYHRNHLPVMSSSPVSFASGHGAWDFTTSLEQAFTAGGIAMKALGGGVFGLFASDLNADGMITANDFNIWLPATKSAVTGYTIEDANLDGQVTASDFNLWLANTKAAAASQVP